MSVRRKVIVVLSGLLVLPVVVGAAFLLTFDANQYRDIVLAQLSRSVNRPVEAAELELQLLPLRLRLNDVRIPEDASFPGEEFIRARAIQFDFSLLSLLRGRPQVSALELDQPTVYLRQDRSGRWNVATLPSQKTEPAAAAPPASKASPAAAPVRNWELRDGTIVVERTDRPTLRLTGVELEVKNISTTRRFPFRLAVNFSPESRVSAAGRLGPLDLDTPAQTPFEAELKLKNFRPAALESVVSVPPRIQRLGTMAGTLNVNSSPQEVALAGEVNLLDSRSGEEVAVQINATLPADFSGIALREVVVESGDARIIGSGLLALAPTAPLDLSLRTSEADLRSLLQIPPPLGVPLPMAVPAKGEVTAELKAKGTPGRWGLTGSATFRDLAIELKGWKRPLRVESVEVTLEPERIVAAPFQLSLQRGLSLRLAGMVEDYRRRARLRARVTGEDVPVEPLLDLAARFGKSPLKEGQSLTGRVSPAIDVSGPLQEPAKLSYRGTLTLRNVFLTTPPLAEPVGIPAVQVALNPARLTTQPFTAQVGEKLRARVTMRLDNYRSNPLMKAQVRTAEADLGALLELVRALGKDPLPGGTASGRVTATIDLSGPLAEKAPPLVTRGQAQLTFSAVQPAALAEPLEIERADLEFAPDRLLVSNLRLAAAGMKMQGSMRVQNFDAPRVNFSLRGETLDVERLQALFRAQQALDGRGPIPPALVGVVHAREKSGDWFARLGARGRLAFNEVRHGTLTLAPFASPVVVADQVVTCNPIEFGLYEGGGRGRLVIDLRGREPVTEFNGLLRNVDANKLLSENSKFKNRLYGRLGGTLAVRFAGSERSRIIHSANGQGQVTLVDGRLAQINLSRQLVAVGRLVGLTYEQRHTPIEDLNTEFEIADGWMRTSKLTLRTRDLTMEAVGGFSLDDELAFEATATFTREASQRISSRGPLGAVASSFFTDDQGRLVIPFVIRGAFAQPKLNLDAARLAEMKLHRGKTEPGGLLGDILDRLRKRKEPPP